MRDVRLSQFPIVLDNARVLTRKGRKMKWAKKARRKTNAASARSKIKIRMKRKEQVNWTSFTRKSIATCRRRGCLSRTFRTDNRSPSQPAERHHTCAAEGWQALRSGQEFCRKSLASRAACWARQRPGDHNPLCWQRTLPVDEPAWFHRTSRPDFFELSCNILSQVY